MLCDLSPATTQRCHISRLIVLYKQSYYRCTCTKHLGHRQPHSRVSACTAAGSSCCGSQVAADMHMTAQMLDHIRSSSTWPAQDMVQSHKQQALWQLPAVQQSFVCCRYPLTIRYSNLLGNRQTITSHLPAYLTMLPSHDPSPSQQPATAHMRMCSHDQNARTLHTAPL